MTEFRPDPERLKRFLACIAAVDWTALNAALKEGVDEGRAILERPDWIWIALVRSAATLQGTPDEDYLWRDHRAEWDWSVIGPLAVAEPNKAKRRMEDIFRRSKIRFAAMKAGWAVKNAAMIACDTPERIKASWLDGDLQARIAQLQKFAGVGPKYARNIGMDVRDPLFEDCFALDSRVMRFVLYLDPRWAGRKTISKRDYLEIERGMRQVAQAASKTPWELDRCIYFRVNELADCLGLPRSRRRSRKVQCR